MSRIRTVLFHLLGHLLVLCFLWDFHLESLNYGWKSVGNCHLVMYVAVVCVFCAFLLMVFLSCPRGSRQEAPVPSDSP